jgi:membrane fusion protein (multidrug efflux system)
MSSGKGIRLIVGLWAAGLVLGLGACDSERWKKIKGKADAAVEVAPINVEAAYPVRRDMEEVLELTGNLEPIEKVEVYAKQGGTLKSVEVNAGDLVKANQLLAKVDDKELRLSYQQSESAYLSTKEKYQRYQDLSAQKMVSVQDYQDLERAFRDAKINLDMAKIRLDNAEIRSPIAGTVADRRCDPNKLVGSMESIFTVARLDRYRIPISVTESEIGKIKLGQAVKIRVDAVASNREGYPFQGAIAEISPMVNPQNGMVAVKVEVPNPGGELKMGMFARLRIITAIRPHAMAVQKKALAGEEVNQVWVVEGDHGRLTPVKVGLRDNEYVEVLSGLDPDKMVIIEGHTALTEKNRIQVVNKPIKPATAADSRSL